MNPIISVYNPQDLSFHSAISCYTSLSWENKARDAGSFTIHIPRKNLMPKDAIVRLHADVKEPYGIVLSQKIKDDETVIYGKMLSYVLATRYPDVSGSSITYSTNQGVGKLLCTIANYGVIGSNKFFDSSPIFDFVPENVSLSYEAELGESTLSALTSVAADSNSRFSMTVDNGAIRFSAGCFTDSGLTLSESLGGLQNICYELGTDNKRTSFCYTLEQNGSYTHISSPSVNKPAKFNKKEIYLGTYSSAPSAEIRRKSAFYVENDTLSGELIPSLYDKISVGQTVNIDYPSYRIQKSFEITERQDVFENGHKVYVTFGTPLPTVYEKIIRRI